MLNNGLVRYEPFNKFICEIMCSTNINLNRQIYGFLRVKIVGADEVYQVMSQN